MSRPRGPSQALGPGEAGERTLLERLTTMAAQLVSDPDVDTVLARIVGDAAELMAADAAGFVVTTDRTWEVAAVVGLPADLVGVGGTYADGGVIDRARRAGGVVVFDTAASLADLPGVPDLPVVTGALAQIGTLAVVPAVVRGDTIGVLVAAYEARGRSLTDDDLGILRLLADLAGAALANARAYAEVVAGRRHEKEVVDAMPDGVAVVGPDGLVVGWNRAAERITGIARHDAVGRPLPFPPGPPGEPREHQLSVDVWVEAIAASLPAGETVHSFRDVSVQKALEEAKDLFLGTIGHELRTPLTVIKGFASTLRDRSDQLSPADRREAAETIVRRADRLVALVEQIMLGIRTEATRYDVRLDPLDLAASLHMAASDFEDGWPGHRLVVDVPDDLPPVVGDRAAVEHAVTQLLDNAFKYSPEGGTVRVSARPEGSEVVVSVTDEGIGLTPAQRDQVFDRFWQGEPGTARFGGVGLGLHIVRRLVERQGGRVWADGRAGEGATFSFTLRRA